MSSGLPRPIRAVFGVVALVVLLILVNSWLRDYRSEPETAGVSVETTVTADGTEEPADDSDGEGAGEEGEAPDEPAATEATVVVIIEGLNFRREPSRTGELIRGLRLNDELAHLGTEDGWYHVRDGEGVEGYVSANPQYTELRE